MWWLIFVVSVIVFLIAGAVYLELQPVRRRARRFDRTTDSATNHTILQQQASSLRNQSSGL